MAPFIEGFSKLSKEEKIRWLATHYLSEPEDTELLKKYWHPDNSLQRLHDSFVENTLTNFYLPFAVAPNFLINGRTYAVPMVIEESSVVAAASKAAKFWYRYGGFKSEVLSRIKTGHIHLFYYGDPDKLTNFFLEKKEEFLQRLKPFTENMEKRGGGILSVELQDLRDKLDNYFVIEFQFDTVDSMGANFINTILEEWADYMTEDYAARGNPSDLEISMRILSNYAPRSVVHVSVEAPADELNRQMPVSQYAEKFVRALRIAQINPYRAVTHNKGIMNGIDAVVVATGNDFRAVEAAAHAYAARQGRYQSLSEARIADGIFKFEMKIPLTVGVVGGVTKNHPLARLALKMLGNPSAGQLMEIMAAVGLAQNFSAVHSLITEGIQKGHMRMHLTNILMQMEATDQEKRLLADFFRDKKVHVKAVKEKLHQLRKNRSL